jgi:hypothetical protein
VRGVKNESESVLQNHKKIVTHTSKQNANISKRASSPQSTCQPTSRAVRESFTASAGSIIQSNPTTLYSVSCASC